ncbi:hypothetical protein CANCADRAFT_1079 [Tortispora caseinolytica NRRL Y-17796]|uniref:Protein YIP n=1 Tax=Tortispora caseinolytica NRRL Y-17796 TaxID=767744 RepID=A0A1E4TL51_9ASCO|nr:hypothetical protein CANCADRAFT_1079 [Tortispora caseinolytica NRRL Y-17796]
MEDRPIQPDIESNTYNYASQAREIESNIQELTGEQTQDRRFTGGDTLDEPVLTTLNRDLKQVGRRVIEVLYPKLRGDTENSNLLREWDLWGPLIFCLFLSLFLSFSAKPKQRSLVFSGVFAVVWLGEAVATLNIKLLGGKVSFFRVMSVLGYSLFPLVLAAFISLLVGTPWVRIPVHIALVCWSVVSSTQALRGSGIPSNKVLLSIYPVALFYVTLGWLTIIT